ncbi:MAG: 2OG-Fe(II) oxygenase [Gammaproteobacteria bacterium]
MNQSTQVAPYVFEELAPNSFIFRIRNAIPGWICQEMVSRFESRPQDQYKGRIGQTASEDNTIKKTMDIAISGNKDWADVDNILHRSMGLAIREFRERYPYFKGPFKDIGYNMQRYRPGEYYHWHIDGGSHDFANRQLVALWYLNDVPAPGGATEFKFQNVSVQPEEGTLVLFPPFWTHEHRAETIQKGVKYIATTWVTFA